MPPIYTRRNSLRWAEFDYNSARRYFVTITTFDRKKHLNNKWIAEMVISELMDLRERFHLKLYSFCLMHDHLHALVGLTIEELSLGRAIGAFKSISTRQFWKYEDGLLWQRQYFDHVIRDREDFWNVVDYIRMNPVKAGLSESWHDYMYYGEPDMYK